MVSPTSQYFHTLYLVMNVFIESYRESINKKERGSKFQMSACDKSFKYLFFLSKLIIMNGKELIFKTQFNKNRDILPLPSGKG